jgi:hypothetical protein
MFGSLRQRRARRLRPRIDVVDLTVEAVEGAGLDLDDVALAQADADLRTLLAVRHARENGRDLGLRERHRLAARAEEIAEARRLAQRDARLARLVGLGVRDVGLHHQVARVELAADDFLLAALEIRDALEGHQDLRHDALQVRALDARLELAADRILAARLAADEVPLVGGCHGWSHSPMNRAFMSAPKK